VGNGKMFCAFVDDLNFSIAKQKREHEKVLLMVW